MNNSRLEIQAKIRQMGRNPSNTDRQIVETAREQLSGLLTELKNAMNAAGIVESNLNTPPSQESLGMWDDILYEPVPAGPNAIPIVEDRPASSNSPISSICPIQIEEQLIPLPSNGNVGQAYAPLELSHRIEHADHHLGQIRDLIAEKSFQYSHVIRVSPRKGVNTQSRAAVKKLNLQISVQCRLYTQCRSKLLTLGADPTILNRFQALKTEDVKSSTAIVNPNEPGSTRIKLSWIWQTAGGHRWGLTSGSEAGADRNIFECKFLLPSCIFDHSLFTVRRVHWLRARAQLKRWQEQLTLTTYEMQWSVRYFGYMSRKWIIPIGLATHSSSESELGTGAIAYRKRKQAAWGDLMIKADSIFARCNKTYDSPL